MKPKQLVNVLLFSDNRKEYLFKCKSCGMIVSADFGEEYFLDILDLIMVTSITETSSLNKFKL